jgi:protein-tyrosine phosphatase
MATAASQSRSFPGLWTATYHDIDSTSKLESLNAPMQLVVNSAICQCEARTGFYGSGVEVIAIELEDDPDARKAFDAGKESKSACADDVPLVKRCAGDAKKDFDRVSREIEATSKRGGAAIVHCKASLSRSAAFIIAHLMRTRGLTLLEAGAIMKSKWAATWPCDRFVYQLIEYEKELAKPIRLSIVELGGVIACSLAAGVALTTLLQARR